MRVIWTYPFPLNDGSFAELHLPPDLTQKEADRIKQFLDAVVLEPEEPEATP